MQRLTARQIEMGEKEPKLYKLIKNLVDERVGKNSKVNNAAVAQRLLINMLEAVPSVVSSAVEEYDDLYSE